MTLISFVCTIAMSTFVATPDRTATVQDPPVVFVGTTPCSNIIRPLHKITPEDDCALKECHCIMVEWTLTLYTDANTKEPATFKLTSINRFSVKETNQYSQPGTSTESEGKWIVVRGTKTDPDAIVYQLNPDKPEIALKCVKLNNNLLHILDHDGRLMIGNEFWSYTLNRAPK
jgi:hypothetical protein